MLASHSQVDGTFELPNVLTLVHRLRGRRPVGDPRYPAVLAELDGQSLRRLGESYLDETRMHRGSAPFFTDKMPIISGTWGLFLSFFPRLGSSMRGAIRWPAAVRTASSEQVRQPLYADGVGHWRHYEPWLEPLKRALGPALTR